MQWHSRPLPPAPGQRYVTPRALLLDRLRLGAPDDAALVLVYGDEAWLPLERAQALCRRTAVRFVRAPPDTWAAAKRGTHGEYSDAVDPWAAFAGGDAVCARDGGSGRALRWAGALAAVEAWPHASLHVFRALARGRPGAPASVPARALADGPAAWWAVARPDDPAAPPDGGSASPPPEPSGPGVTSVDCLERMYGEALPWRSLGAFGAVGIDGYRTQFRRDEAGKPVYNEVGRKIVERKESEIARETATRRDAAIFAFDAGSTSDDPEVRRRAGFNKRYLVGTWEAAADVVERGHPHIRLYDHETGQTLDLGQRNCSYECLMFHRPTRLILDCEFVPSNNPDIDLAALPAMMDAVVDLVRTLAHELTGITLERHAFLVLTADGADKVSRHVICMDDRFVLRNVLVMEWFYRLANDRLVEAAAAGEAWARSLFVRDGASSMIPFWDFGTAKNFQLMRTLDAHKFGTDRPLRYDPALAWPGPPDGPVATWAALDRRGRWLGALLQRLPHLTDPRRAEPHPFVDFCLRHDQQIGRFVAVVRDGMLEGFRRAGARRVGPRPTIPTRTSRTNRVGELAEETWTALRDWIRGCAWADVWPDGVWDNPNPQWRRGRGGGLSVQVQLVDGTGAEGGVHCYRRPAAGKRKAGAPEGAKHSGCPVLLYVEYSRRDRGWVVNQACNNVNTCGGRRSPAWGPAPPGLADLLDRETADLE